MNGAKTFNHLRFKPHPLGFPGLRQATMTFWNGYGISVVHRAPYCKANAYSGTDTYEVGLISPDGSVGKQNYGWQTREQVSNLMLQQQRMCPTTAGKKPRRVGR